MEEDKLKQTFSVFDQNGDEFIDKDEFVFCWNHWIKIVNVQIQWYRRLHTIFILICNLFCYINRIDLNLL